MSELVIAKEYNLLKDAFLKLQNFSEKILEVRKSIPNLEPLEGSEVKEKLGGYLDCISRQLSELKNTYFPRANSLREQLFQNFGSTKSKIENYLNNLNNIGVFYDELRNCFSNDYDISQKISFQIDELHKNFNRSKNEIADGMSAVWSELASENAVKEYQKSRDQCLQELERIFYETNALENNHLKLYEALRSKTQNEAERIHLTCIVEQRRIQTKFLRRYESFYDNCYSKCKDLNIKNLDRKSILELLDYSQPKRDIYENLQEQEDFINDFYKKEIRKIDSLIEENLGNIVNEPSLFKEIESLQVRCANLNIMDLIHLETSNFTLIKPDLDNTYKQYGQSLQSLKNFLMDDKMKMINEVNHFSTNCIAFLEKETQKLYITTKSMDGDEIQTMVENYYRVQKDYFGKNRKTVCEELEENEEKLLDISKIASQLNETINTEKNNKIQQQKEYNKEKSENYLYELNKIENSLLESLKMKGLIIHEVVLTHWLKLAQLLPFLKTFELFLSNLESVAQSIINILSEFNQMESFGKSSLINWCRCQFPKNEALREKIANTVALMLLSKPEKKWALRVLWNILVLTRWN